jgi:hypothetical protein
VGFGGTGVQDGRFFKELDLDLLPDFRFECWAVELAKSSRNGLSIGRPT